METGSRAMRNHFIIFPKKTYQFGDDKEMESVEIHYPLHLERTYHLKRKYTTISNTIQNCGEGNEKLHH